MSTNTAEQNFNADIQKTIKSLDLMDSAVAEKVATAMREGAEMIVHEQKKLVAVRSQKLASLISAGKLTVTPKSGKTVIKVGYDSNAIKEGFEGLLVEYGRPGKERGGVMKYTYKNGTGKEHKRKIGKFTPTPHIRRGFDNKADEAAEQVLNELWEEVDKAWTS